MQNSMPSKSATGGFRLLATYSIFTNVAAISGHIWKGNGAVPVTLKFPSSLLSMCPVDFLHPAVRAFSSSFRKGGGKLFMDRTLK
jgi:hypothetical protein